MSASLLVPVNFSTTALVTTVQASEIEDANRVSASLGIDVTVLALILEPVASNRCSYSSNSIKQCRGYDCFMSRCVR